MRSACCDFDCNHQAHLLETLSTATPHLLGTHSREVHLLFSVLPISLHYSLRLSPFVITPCEPICIISRIICTVQLTLSPFTVFIILVSIFLHYSALFYLPITLLAKWHFLFLIKHLHLKPTFETLQCNCRSIWPQLASSLSSSYPNGTSL